MSILTTTLTVFEIKHVFDVQHALLFGQARVFSCPSHTLPILAIYKRTAEKKTWAQFPDRLLICTRGAHKICLISNTAFICKC